MSCETQSQTTAAAPVTVSSPPTSSVSLALHRAPRAAAPAAAAAVTAAPKVAHGHSLSLSSTTSSLLMTDAASALLASYCLAPFITMVDVSIIRNANGTMPMRPGLTGLAKALVTSPHTQLNPFARKELAAIWMVYGSTYLAANSTATICKHVADINPAFPVFLATTATNLPLSVVKDRFLSRYFGTPAARKAAVPLTSVLCFGVRDALTIAASFSAVPILTDYLVKRHASVFSRADNPYKRANQVSQMVLPVVMQVVSTPVHLLGLDLYNRATNIGAAGRISFIRREFFASLMARQLRIGFAYGIGGIANHQLKDSLKF